MASQRKAAIRQLARCLVRNHLRVAIYDADRTKLLKKRQRMVPDVYQRKDGSVLDHKDQRVIVLVGAGSSAAAGGGNQTRSAEQLRIGSATLYRKLKKYGLIGQSPNRRNKLPNGSKR